jgi:hypothetical protein
MSPLSFQLAGISTSAVSHFGCVDCVAAEIRK